MSVTTGPAGAAVPPPVGGGVGGVGVAAGVGAAGGGGVAGVSPELQAATSAAAAKSVGRSVRDVVFVMVRLVLAQAASVQTVRRARRFAGHAPAVLAWASLAGACGAGPAPCGDEADCPTGTVCQPSGRCEPLALDPVLRAARAMRLLPVAARAVPSQADAGEAYRLGGPTHAVVLLSFTALPPGAHEATAELVLTPDPASAAPGQDRLLVVDRVRPPGRTGDPAVFMARVAERVIGPDSRGRYRVDMTALVRACARAGALTLDVALRVEGDGALRVLSATAPEHADRPRLEVYVP